MQKTVHIIGAGLAGLAAAVRLSMRGTEVVVHEATTFRSEEHTSELQSQ